MPGFLSAHGYDPGPTQRPGAAGAIAGLISTVPATAVLAAFGSLRIEAQILGLPASLTVAAGCVVMSITGALYGRLFQRAANDRRGGWLFGMLFGFVLWTAGSVMILPLLSGGLAPGGVAAIGVLLSLLAWGTSLGALFRYVHRPLHADLEGKSVLDRVGPAAAAPRHGPGRSTRR